ncbi:hypothetical protein G6F23_015340 [Rhizopus arrhizus]|nr:hypothetical protein G6F23_015340 [Rhizopus arrhizus]
MNAGAGIRADQGRHLSERDSDAWMIARAGIRADQGRHPPERDSDRRSAPTRAGPDAVSAPAPLRRWRRCASVTGAAGAATAPGHAG